MKRAWPLVLWIGLACWMAWWLHANPLPDGYQNEYLHIGNAYDLWETVLDGDLYMFRHLVYEIYYWPWAFYAMPWPAMALLGPGRAALLSVNLLYLAILLWSASTLGRIFRAPLAPLLVVLCPGVFGGLVRYEPNLADIAWTTAGLACLLSSRRLRDLTPSLGWGACLGVGLMLDRLSVLFFLVPAVLPLLWPLERRAIRNFAASVGVALFLSAAYYREFFINHSSELLSQAPVGEIDSVGTLTVGGGWLYYPMVLIDSQAGPLLGVAMLCALIAAAIRCVRRPSDPAAVLLAAVLPGMLFFTLVAKQQVYYTLPILGALSVLAASHRPLAWLGVIGGLWSFLALGIGVIPGGPWMPEAWVSPRHVLARPPSHQVWPFAPAMDALDASPGASILVFSEDQTLFEGFLILQVRESWPGRRVFGVTLNPNGSHEFLEEAESVIWVGDPGAPWPTLQAIHTEIRMDGEDPVSYDPIGESLAGASERFREVGRWPAGDRELVVFRSR